MKVGPIPTVSLLCLVFLVGCSTTTGGPPVAEPVESQTSTTTTDSGAPGGPTPTTTNDRSTTVPEVGSTTVTSRVTETSAPLSPVCDAWLEFVSSGDPGGLSAVLEDPDLIDALDVSMSLDAEFEAIIDASRRLESAIIDQCGQEFSRAVQPAATDEAALERFFDALVANDARAAEGIASLNVLAQIAQVWTPVAAADIEWSVDGSTGTYRFDSSTVIECEASGGIVVRCVFGE